MKKIIVLALAIILALAVGSGYAVEVTLLGPKQYSRTTDAPNIYADNFPGRPGMGKIIVQNGGVDGVDLVSGAIVKVNGIEVFGVNAFNQKVPQLDRDISLCSINRLSVELRSKPGTCLLIRIVQEIDADSAEVIGADGGDVTVKDPVSPLFGYKISIPAGAIFEPLIVAIKYIPDLRVPYNIQREECFELPAFEISPDGTVLDMLANIFVPLPDADSDGIVDGSNLPLICGGLYYLDQAKAAFIRNEAEIDQEQKGIVAQTNHFSFWVPWLGRWQKNTTVYYDLEDEPFPSFTNHDADSITQEIQAAFDKWSAAIDRTVKFVRSGPLDLPDFQVTFMDDYPWDNELGRVVRDFNGAPFKVILPIDDYYWVTEDYVPYANYLEIPEPFKVASLRTFLHEFGHTMRLPDYSKKNDMSTWNQDPPPSSAYSLMRYDDSDDCLNFPFTELSEFDIQQIRELYDLPEIGQNLIPNPSFEEADESRPGGIARWNLGPQARRANTGHQGSYSVEIPSPGGGASTWYNIDTPGFYQVRFWIRSDSECGQITFSFDDTPPWPFFLSSIGEEWQMIEFQVFLEQGEQSFGFFRWYEGPCGSVWVDDVSITRIH